MNPQIHIQPYSSPCGELLLGSFGDKICLCDWANNPKLPAARRRLEQTLSGAEPVAAPSPATELAAQELSEYFAGERWAFSVPLLLVGTEFQKAVWRALMRTIPYGETLSYAALAQVATGRPETARAVAAAVGANHISIIVPCHRVVGRSGKLTGYAGGLEAKQYLLQLEGTGGALRSRRQSPQLLHGARHIQKAARY